MSSASLNNQFRRWASNWEALEDTLHGIQLEKKTLCAEIRDASSRQTLEAFKTAMRIMHMDETKQATRVAIDQEATLILNTIRSVNADPTTARSEGVEAETQANGEEADEEIVETVALANSVSVVTEAIEPPTSDASVGARMTVVEAVADVPMEMEPDCDDDKEIVPLDGQQGRGEQVMRAEPAIAKAERPPYNHAAYLKERYYDRSDIEELDLSNAA